MGLGGGGERPFGEVPFAEEPSAEAPVVAPVMQIGVVPIRYVVGVIPNVVPVETVLVATAGVVPCRVFTGPENVVPVRETASEFPRVRVILV